jgi:rhodanese-related sulfurtransferase
MQKLILVAAGLLIASLLGYLAYGTDLLPTTGEHADDVLQGFEVGVTDLNKLLASNQPPRLLDVREPSELTETGALPGVLNLPLGSISANILAELIPQKTDPIVTICRSGARSAQAYRLLTALGYTNVKSLQGGIIHWEEDGEKLSPWTGNTELAKSEKPEPEERDLANAPIITLDRTEHDFGQIPQFGGVVTADFIITNIGTDELDIGQITTSCSCTTAKVSSMKLVAGESATMTVIFDPDFHEEPLDRFRRTVFIPTNDPTQPEVEINVWVDILEGQ